jgi:hypothetical protein
MLVVDLQIDNLVSRAKDRDGFPLADGDCTQKVSGWNMGWEMTAGAVQRLQGRVDSSGI